MNTTEMDKTNKEITVKLTDCELSIINNSLNEVLELFIDDTEFRTRIGESKIKVESTTTIYFFSIRLILI